jgi:methylated-DNA-[protein]-cysteine S-methyltransferase
MAQKLVDNSPQKKNYYDCMDTPVGKLVLESDEDAILSIHISGFAEPMHDLPTISAGQILPTCLESCKKQLGEYFQGSRVQFDLPLSPRGTPFQKRVWAELESIPFGQTISYLELARRLGDPKVIRAAGTANGKNPIAIIIPCHRVIGSKGDLVGYAGGLINKNWLLKHESSNAGGISQLSLFDSV